MNKILIVDDLHPYFKKEANRIGYICDDFPSITLPEVENIIGNYVGLAIRTKFQVNESLLDKATQLKFIARAGAGMDNIDLKTALNHNIICINAPEANRDAVGEHTIGMLLGLMNKLRQADNQIREGIWDREGNRGYELKGKTVGIIGYGFMGSAFAEKLASFGVNILAYDKYKTTWHSSPSVQKVDLATIFHQTDILSIHIPLTTETKGWISQPFLNEFKKPFFFINTSRGEIVDTPSVLQKINEGRIIGAALDVLEIEKFPQLYQQIWYQQLIENKSVLLSPHVAGWTFESYQKISEVLAQKLKNLKI